LFNRIADEKVHSNHEIFIEAFIESIDHSITRKEIHVDRHMLNTFENMNTHLAEVSKKLAPNGYYITQAVTLEDWRIYNRNKLKTPYLKFHFRLYSFLIYRVVPRVKFLNFIKSSIFKSKKVLISKAEILGRLAYSGFEIYDFRKINGSHIFITKKISAARTNKVSEGPIFTQDRIGKKGKKIKVYKLRTMHPYSEFIHGYMLSNHGFGSTGKIKDDFRMTKWAKIFRKYWLDELPQLLNLIKGDMKLVGLRPVSQSYFEILPSELQKIRKQFKPGCIPPYVSLDMKSTFEEVLKAEIKYMKSKKQKPFTTDFVYFFKAVFNVAFKNKRSY
jgi:lipopolysaccharide/colanic/teichoic acid biosynthesis glycosyltransferase